MMHTNSGDRTAPLVGLRVVRRHTRDVMAAKPARTADPRRQGRRTREDAKRRSTSPREPTKEADSWGQMARNRRLSLTSSRVNGLVLLVVGLVWWGLSRILPVPRWLMGIIVAVTAFSFILDVVNVLCINARIRRRVGPAIRQRRQRS